jgi:epoxide hydrolase-like predicted phosphatase
MPQPIRTVIFDVGGVLVRTEDPTPRQQLAAELNLPMNQLYDIVFNQDTWNLVQLGHITNDDHWQAVGRRLKLTWPDQVNAFRTTFFAGDRLDQGMISLIQRLRSRFKVALLSNAPGNLRRWIAEEWNIPPDTFDQIVISAEEGVMKPDPEIYQRTLTRLDVAPHEAIFVDDFEENVEAARALGIQAILFTSPENLIAALNSRIEVSLEGSK